MTSSVRTARDIVTRGLRKAGLLGFGEVPSPEDAEVALQELDDMLKGWQAEPYTLWTQATGSIALTTGAEHTLDPIRPLRLLSVRLRRNGVDIPMIRLTRDEYDRLPLKDAYGSPTLWFFDRQREAARLYVWPLTRAVAGETLVYTYERELPDLTSLNSEIDVPGEWWDAVVYNLAARLLETVPVQANPNLAGRAQYLLDKALANEQEGSVFFAGEWADW